MSPEEKERAVWELSAKINARGFHVDRPFIEAARRIARAAGPEIDAELAVLTNGAVTSNNQVARMLTWLQQEGCALQKLDKKAVARQLDKEDLPPVLRRVLELRAGGAQSAVKKYDALLARAGSDDRVRGAFRYWGAATGRWSGEGVQPQNFKRATVEDLPAAIAAVATGNYERKKNLYPQRVLAVLGDCLRSTVAAAPGHILIGADLNAIESRDLAWLVGETWKLDAYARFDATRDPRDEVYCQTACRIFGKPPGSFDKDSPERTIGKTADLAFGFQGGLNAFRKFMPDKFSDEEVEQFKRDWRATHPATVKFWHAIDRAAVLAVRERGRIVRCGRIDLRCSGMFLQMKLPSGRKLSYPQPRIITDKHGKPRVVFADNAAGKFVDCRFGMGAYGGLWTENIVQAIARDVLVEAMLRLEAAGYPIVLHVHDEIVAEVPEGFGRVEEFIHLMTRRPSWALDLPIAASGWTDARYRK